MGPRFGAKFGEMDSILARLLRGVRKNARRKHWAMAPAARREHAGESPDLQNNARVLASIDSGSPIMLGPWDEWRNLTLTGGSILDFLQTIAA